MKLQPYQLLSQFTIRWLIAFSLIALTGSIEAEPEIKGSPTELQNFLHPDQKTIALKASTQEVIEPNQALVKIKVTTNSSNLSDAIEFNQTIREKIAARLISSGIASQNIRISQFSSSQNNDWTGGNQKNYSVSNLISLRIFNEAQFKAMAKAVDDHIELQIHNVEFINVSQAELEKYKNLYERETGKSLGNDFKVEISSKGKNSRRVSVSIEDDSN